jgi:hypothetical protein
MKNERLQLMKLSNIDAEITREVYELRLRCGGRVSSLPRCEHPRQLGHRT